MKTIAKSVEKDRQSAGFGKESSGTESNAEFWLTAGSGNPTVALLAVWICCLAAVILAYWPSLSAMAEIWNIDPNYSHGFLVPLISAVFVYRTWGRVGPPVDGDVPRGDIVRGGGEVLIGGLLHLVGWTLGNWVLDVAALILIFQGLLLILAGRARKKAYSVPVLFLIFMAPLPIAWYQPVAIVMQQMVSALSHFVLETCGVPSFREGYMIHLPGYMMEVGEACSGLRQLTGMIALAVGIGFWNDHSRIYRGTLAVSALVLAIVANTVRIVLTGFIMTWFGPKWADGVFHTLEGLAVMGVAAALLFLLAWALQKAERAFGWKVRGLDESLRRETPRADHASRCVLRGGLAVLLAAVVWLGEFGFRHHVEAAGPLPVVTLDRALQTLPDTLGDWQGRDRSIDDPDLLYADAHLQREYHHAATRQSVLVWLVYSQRGEDRSHHPEVCMAVAGQVEDPSARRTLPLPGHAAPVQQYRFGRTGSAQWVYYWYYTLQPQSSSQLSYLQQLYQRLRYRPSSLTVEVFAPERDAEDVAAAREFVGYLDQALQPVVGDRAVRGSRRKPVARIEVDDQDPAGTHP